MTNGQPTALAEAMFQGFTLLKMGAAILVVVALALVAERAGPKLAGILSGFPLGAAITLFFIGYETGPEFAAQSALYTALGLTATQTFAYGYYRTTKTLSGCRKSVVILFASVGGTITFLLVGYALTFLKVSLITSTPASALSMYLFHRLLRPIENIRLDTPFKPGPGTHLFRALFAAVFIVLITSAAKLTGASLAGVLSAFPVTMFPLIAIIHFTYEPEHVYTIIKNVPRGLGSILAYTVVIHLSYPVHGIYLGTLEAYLVATLYLIAFNLDRRPELLHLPNRRLKL